jgi:hypothetical protein
MILHPCYRVSMLVLHPAVILFWKLSSHRAKTYLTSCLARIIKEFRQDWMIHVSSVDKHVEY